MFKKFYQYKIYPDGIIMNKNTIIKPDYSTNIPTVKLTLRGQRVRYRLPNLILCVWYDLNIEALKQDPVVYKDGDKHNNHISNLRFGKPDIKRRTVNDIEINEIKNIYHSNEDDTYVSYRDLANMYGVSVGTIYNIIKNK